MNKILATVAINEQYKSEAVRLQNSVGEDIFVFTEDNPLYNKVHDNSTIDGLYHKCNFANYIDTVEVDTPVIFMDADMFSLSENPLSTFNVETDVDFAFVPYTGKYSFPDTDRQRAFDFFGCMINSGFMYFKNISIARQICTAWAEIYLIRSAESYEKYDYVEYDEYSLMLAIEKMGLNVSRLDAKWNMWTLSTRDEMAASGGIFFQSHNLGIR